ncbi:putative lipase-like [Cocos nucifera]|uniref:Putative lipase-like n=1 Tax=Cocos nucifera TaxID=13894 RepID=A0A8K0HWX3_COCNU|nr:putative lipase-like [Cocos nucifera]
MWISFNLINGTTFDSFCSMFGLQRLGGLSYFAGAEKKDERVLVPDLGRIFQGKWKFIHFSSLPISDLKFDCCDGFYGFRARELFCYLKGGQVDFGEEHSRIYGHSQFGKNHGQGHHPEWDEHHPIHFVGHSAGVQVVRLLRQMLSDKEFSGYENTSEDWVLSITSLSGELNGTTRTYYDGMQPEDGRSMKSVSLLQICRLGVIFYDWLHISWLKNYCNFGFDHFETGWRKTGVTGLIDLPLGNAGPFASGDWILPDLTIQGGTSAHSLRG